MTLEYYYGRDGDMPRNDKSYTSTIWDKSFLLTIIVLATVGIFKTLELLEEDQSVGDIGATGGGNDADGDE